LLPDLLEKLSEWLEGQKPGSLVLLVDEYEAPLTATLEDPKLFNLILKSSLPGKTIDGIHRIIRGPNPNHHKEPLWTRTIAEKSKKHPHRKL
uniref:hypothetical protein n=1 Tax=Parasutterella excrementihominis TaxID=487175 RepID=UPI003A9431D1